MLARKNGGLVATMLLTSRHQWTFVFFEVPYICCPSKLASSGKAAGSQLKLACAIVNPSRLYAPVNNRADRR
jgi:hypothetical protein